ncbi:uncharacterized protein KD926_000719 [Aspergillus affinis]|uniref:uncharacterized protein n=1 Tax=Aspergillus affinis TaxID=1070780 RepID=UPI0022FE135E|nr:uncharacterized protein KD926_000719 [Aspergillus affinis]KAI9037213.1 hypothetical protein KD926_000719 [Aspergillus affinis]
MEAQFTDEQLMDLLQSLDNLPQSTSPYGLGINPSSLGIESFNSASFDHAPSFAVTGNEFSSVLEEATGDGADMTKHETLQSRVDDLEQELNYMRTILKQLKAYLIHLQPWMMEVTEALDKLGDGPETPTGPVFTADEEI